MAKSIHTPEGSRIKQRVVRGLKVIAGTGLMFVLPARRRKVEQIATIPWHDDSPLDGIDRLIRVSVLWWRSKDPSGSKLADLHQGFWRKQQAKAYYKGTEGRFTNVFLPHFDQFLDSAAEEMARRDIKNIVEIGCGDGQLLRHMHNRLRAERYVGLDLSEDQIEKNKAHTSPPELEYHSGDAAAWIAQHTLTHTLYVTGLGVLEYFTQVQLHGLLRDINSNSRPTAFLLIEPVDPAANFEEFEQSYVAGEEHSFTHNYPKLLTDTGWTVMLSRDIQLDPYRWHVALAISE